LLPGRSASFGLIALWNIELERDSELKSTRLRIIPI